MPTFSDRALAFKFSPRRWCRPPANFDNLHQQKRRFSEFDILHNQRLLARLLIYSPEPFATLRAYPIRSPIPEKRMVAPTRAGPLRR